MRKTLKMKLSIFRYAVKPLLASVYMGVGIFVIKYVLTFFINLNDVKTLVGIPILLVIIAISGFMYIHAIIVLGGIKKDDIEEISPKLLKIMPNFLKKNIK